MGDLNGQQATRTAWAPGPFATEREARAAAQHVLDSPPASWGTGNHRLLEDACRIAGIELGAHDDAVLVWLAGFEPSTCAAIAGLIARAGRAGRS